MAFQLTSRHRAARSPARRRMGSAGRVQILDPLAERSSACRRSRRRPGDRPSGLGDTMQPATTTTEIPTLRIGWRRRPRIGDDALGMKSRRRKPRGSPVRRARNRELEDGQLLRPSYSRHPARGRGSLVATMAYPAGSARPRFRALSAYWANSLGEKSWASRCRRLLLSGSEFEVGFRWVNTARARILRKAGYRHSHGRNRR